MENQNQNTLPANPAPAAAPPPQPKQPTPSSVNPEESKVLTKNDKIRRTFFQVLIGCLVAAAGIAVVAVLMGSFNEVLGRALGTIAVVAVHALLSFSYISETAKKDERDGGRSIDLFSNMVFTLIVASFITSTFAIWQLIGSEITGKLYMSYGVLLFATLHADVLYRIRGFEKRIDATVAVNYAFMTVVAAMLMLVIFVSDPADLGEFFYRILAAAGIIDATTTITAVIMHKMYLQKHPVLTPEEAQQPVAQSKNFWKNPFVILLILFLLLQFIGGIIALILA